MRSERDSIQPLNLMNLLGRFVKVMLRCWIGAAALVVAGALVFYIRAAATFVPMYQCSVVFSVTSSYAGGDIFSTTYYDNAAAQQLAAAFPNMLSTDLMRDLIQQELGKDYINGTITANAVENTNMLVLEVRSINAQDSYDILRATVESFPQVAVYMVDNPQAVVMDEPQVPEHPVNSFSWKGAVFRGGLAGGMAACAIGLLITLSSRTVTASDQLKRITNLPIMAILPKVNPKKHRSGKTIVRNVRGDPGMMESLRGLSLKLRKLLAGSGSRVIMITSSASGEGKTTVSVNLARTLAEDGSSVVIVDGDLRKQSVAAQFGRKGTGKGLMGCMKNQKLPVLDCLEQAETENLFYLSGKNLKRGHYSIDARALNSILNTLNEQFDYVVVDTPPCGVVADTMMLCHFATVVLYVVRPDRATEPQIVDNVTMMYDRSIPIEGFVFNGQSRLSRRYGYGYGSKYGYGYGYGYGKSGKS